MRRRPVLLAEVIDMGTRVTPRQDPSMPVELHRAIVHAATAAGPVISELASRGDAAAVLRVAEALGEVGRGQTVRALRLLDEILSGYRNTA